MPRLIYKAQVLLCNAKISFSVSRWPSGAKQLIHLTGTAVFNTSILGKAGHSPGKGEKDVKGPYSKNSTRIMSRMVPNRAYSCSNLTLTLQASRRHIAVTFWPL